MRDRLIELIKEYICSLRIGDGAAYFLSGGVPDLADHLLANGVIVLPCSVGSTIYRIDTRRTHCSHKGEYYDEYYCRNCRHLLNGDCDSHEEPYIFVIKDANAQMILGNEHLLGSRAFLAKEQAEKALAERSKT